MSRVRVKIDLNAFDADGLTKTRLTNASGAVESGRMVVAYEPEDESMFLAMVERVDEQRGYVFLRVNWDSMQDDTSATALETAFELPLVVGGSASSAAKLVSERSFGATGGILSNAFPAGLIPA